MDRSNETAQLKLLANTFEWNLRRLSDLCMALESIADRLPGEVDPHDCLVLARDILPIVRRAHDFEETTIYPLMGVIVTGSPAIANAIERLRLEHWQDESFAEELHDKLKVFATMPGHCSVETLSWMLRGFFDGLRRHVAFEREFLVPLLGSDAAGPDAAGPEPA
jgi:hemerythrin-like domain-containing protein